MQNVTAIKQEILNSSTIKSNRFDRPLLYLALGQSSGELLTDILSGDWDVKIAQTIDAAEEANEIYNVSVGLVYIDHFNVPDISRVMEKLKITNSDTRWIALVSSEALDDVNICGLIKDGFYDYHTLPIDKNRLSVTLGRAHGMVELPSRDLNSEDDGLSNYGLIGRSEAMDELFKSVCKVGDVDAPVLISGESGTGKERTAYAVHGQSDRRGGPFIAVNCGALPATLIQSELFGHEKGSFTGAHQRKIGRFEAAAGGTIFLDEIGDLPLDLQVTLLRFLQEKTIERVGGVESIEVDVRVIAATHVDLEKAIAQGRFREDLYYRLDVLHLEVPPLRDRTEDIELLAKFYFDNFSREKNTCVKGFSQRALDVMRNFSWPGNVRELINRVRQAMVMCESRLIQPTDLGLEGDIQNNRIMTLEKARAAAETSAIYIA